MIIRHAEKPAKGSDKSLSPRGWQRAGALAVLFTADPQNPILPELARPHWIYASGTLTSGSLRPQQTVEPLAEKLGLTPNTSFNPSKAAGASHLPSEPDMIRDVLAKTGVVLISWQHELIPLIASHIPVHPENKPPQYWNSGRFDLIWLFDLSTQSEDSSVLYRFREVPQRLLAGDV